MANMFAATQLPFITDYIALLARTVKTHSGHELSHAQQRWLGFCLVGILLTNAVNWKAFERAGLGKYKLAALSWVFRRSKIPWDYLFQASVSLILSQHGITHGVLVGDDSNRKRAKRTKKIHKAHKVFENKTSGYFNGQVVVFLLLVTQKVTIPVGFRFYVPDPKQVAWEKEDERLKKQGVEKLLRPAALSADPKYPSKADLLLEMIKDFRKHHPQITVKAILADAFFGTKTFMNESSMLCENVQVISQLRSNQIVLFRNREWSLTDYFNAYPGVPQRIGIRGGKVIEALVSSARLYVRAHGEKRFVIAIKYPNEEEYRFLVAKDMGWRTVDIIQTYTLRWLVEVFFEDWKLYEGWANMAKQPGEEGSSRSLILSLLLDHALILHPEQTARLEQNLSACTVGSLRRFCQGEALLEFVRDLLSAENVAERLAQLAEQVKTWFPLAPSGKHMSGRDLGRQEPTPALKYRAEYACAGR